jgi:tetratricopeptide (TPR) repeat protein
LFNNKAAALNLLGRFSESIPILEKCLHVKRKDVLYKNLGDAYFNLGITEKAIINYENAVILNDENH